MKKSLIIRMWGFMFPHIDIRLVGLASFSLGLMVAKLWQPSLYLDWYWYLVIISTVSFLLFLFNSVCIYSIVNFLFKLDKTKSDKE